MKKRSHLLLTVVYFFIVLFCCSGQAFAMHIAEGFLPFKWAGFWWLIMLPFLALGIRHIKELANEKGPEMKMLLAVVGAFVAYGIYQLAKKLGAPVWLAVFLGAAFGDLMTYTVTAFQLAWAFPAQEGIIASLSKFMGVFSITQIPLAITEGLLTVLVFNLLKTYSKEELKKWNY